MFNWIFNNSPITNNMAKEQEKILQLFPELSEVEKQERVDIRLMRDSDIEDDKKSILEAVIKPLQNIKSNDPYILFDFQHYKQVHLGNMIFSSFSSDWALWIFLTLSKFHQERFILFNKNEYGIKIIQGSKIHDLDNVQNIEVTKEYGYSVYNIKANGLEFSEYILNVSNIKNPNYDKTAIVGVNLKFTNQGTFFSIIAENVENIGFDLRAASTIQEMLARCFSYFRFSIKIYDVENSHIIGGKDTSGNYEYVNNTNTTGSLHKSQDNAVGFYEDPQGNCFLANYQPGILGKLMNVLGEIDFMTT